MTTKKVQKIEDTVQQQARISVKRIKVASTTADEAWTARLHQWLAMPAQLGRDPRQKSVNKTLALMREARLHAVDSWQWHSGKTFEEGLVK